MRNDPFQPIELPDKAWRDPNTVAALNERRIGHVFRLARKYGVSQTRIANVTCMGQAEVSRIQSGNRQVMAIDVLERVADGLTMPDQQRLMLGLAPVHDEASRSPQPSTRSAPTTVDRGKEGADAVRRRSFLGLAGGSVIGALTVAPQEAPAALTRLSRALLSYAPSTQGSTALPQLASLRQATREAKRKYQACRYAEAADDLPDVVNTAITLGDAGTAVDYAQRVDVDRIPIVERRASLHIDTASAFVRWGKYSNAYDSLRAAEHVAPEEIATRRSARSALSELLERSPRSLLPEARDMAARAGVGE